MISHHPSEPGGNENCDGQNIMVSFFHEVLQDNMSKGQVALRVGAL